MLEDDFTYVLRKALLGHALTPEQSAGRAGLDAAEVLEFLGGTFSEGVALKLADVLGLNRSAFGGHPYYHPAEVTLPGVRRLVLPFQGDHVNAWLLEDADGSLLVDTGAGEGDLLATVRSKTGALPGHALVTHCHRDHTGGVGELLDSGIPVYGPDGCGGAVAVAGDQHMQRALRIRVLDLSGHCMPSLGYQVDGLGVPVLVTGDALFAGSIGGCPTPARYRLALDRLREVLGSLPDETVLLPGHGPATTLGEERISNPFLQL